MVAVSFLLENVERYHLEYVDHSVIFVRCSCKVGAFTLYNRVVNYFLNENIKDDHLTETDENITSLTEYTRKSAPAKYSEIFWFVVLCFDHVFDEYILKGICIKHSDELMRCIMIQ